ncbi:AAA family ATPase, partial [Curvivirga sp.]|uniref:AAA family ATPase n=1 Tax=Curvivirga sp. TaxID=2856848 RepID=UPI003B59E33E
MVKITKIEIKNFKAFRALDVIDLGEKGQNLLLYGENGSGKTSLYEALKFFLESSEGTYQFRDHRNIFTDETDKGYIKLHFTPDPKLNKEIYECSEDIQNDTKIQPIIDASKAKGFLDYKELLKTNYPRDEENSVNVFDLLVNVLLKNVVNDQAVPTRSFSDQWSDILDVRSSVQDATEVQGVTEEIEDLEAQIGSFNMGLANQLVELQTKASENLRKFGYEDTAVALDFGFQGIEYSREDGMLNYQNIPLKVKFHDENLTAHYRFLNEAKLSAIALSIFLAGFQLQPSSDLKILVIDDALIGLDMSNRLPLIDILDERDFAKYQIILMTYDRTFYEMVKKRKSEDKNWKAAELYCGKVDGYDIPVYVEDKTYLERAREYLDANDYKACAVYVRTAYEATIKAYCEKNNIAVKYREDRNELESNDFWTLIRDKKIPDPKSNKQKRLLKLVLVKKIELARKFTLNPLSHANIVNIPRKELEDAIE